MRIYVCMYACVQEKVDNFFYYILNHVLAFKYRRALNQNYNFFVYVIYTYINIYIIYICCIFIIEIN